MSSYNHTQGSASSSWTISHNLSLSSVVVDVFVDNGGNLEKILPLNVVHTDNNTVTVTFSANQTGRARVVG